MACEVLHQPMASDGLPAGPRVVLDRQPLHFARWTGTNRWAAQVWLRAGIGPDLARDCYYRVTRATHRVPNEFATSTPA